MDLRNLADTYEQTQRVRIQAENRLRAVFQGSDEEIAQHVANDVTVQRLIEAEESVRRHMEAELQKHPCYEWAMGIPGLNRTLAGKIFGLIGDAEQFVRFSNLRTFAGLCPGRNKLVKGEKSCFNRRLKTCLYLFFESSLKAGGMKLKNPPFRRYDEIYRVWRSTYIHRHGGGKVAKKLNGVDEHGQSYTSTDEIAQGWPDLRQHYAAKNKLLDVFLFHVYEEWLEKTSGREPTLYSHTHLGHQAKYDRTDFSSEEMSKQKRKVHTRELAKAS